MQMLIFLCSRKKIWLKNWPVLMGDPFWYRNYLKNGAENRSDHFRPCMLHVSAPQRKQPIAQQKLRRGTCSAPAGDVALAVSALPVPQAERVSRALREFFTAEVVAGRILPARGRRRNRGTFGEKVLEEVNGIGLVHIADALAYALGYGTDVGGLRRRVETSVVERFGIQVKRLEHAACEAMSQIGEMSGLLFTASGEGT